MLPLEEQLDHLRYPTLPINGSIAYYLSRSTLVSMASNPDHLSEDTTSSLGDSTYEILSESTFFASEDEDHEDGADWVASNDQDLSDDLASLADTEDIKQTEDAASSGSLPALGYRSHQSKDCGGDSSIITSKCHDHLSVQSIEFEEPRPYRGAEEVDVIHTVYKFSHEEAFKISASELSSGGSVQFVATIRQTMTRQGLVLDRPFRIVFVGDTSAQNAIVEKVGAALAVPSSWGPASDLAHRRSSRFNIVPISSFGDDASPEVELIDSSGLEIVVDHCTFAEVASGSGSHEIITLTLNESIQCQSTQGWNGFKTELSGDWQLPDIAIVYWSDADDQSARRTRDLAHAFMSRHKVPSIVISQEPLWKNLTVPETLDYKGPHLCLESRGVNVSDNRVLRRLPVDLASFKNIDSGQMNRNLACLTGLHIGKEYPQSSRREHQTAQSIRRSSSGDLEKATTNAARLTESISRIRGLLWPNARAMILIGVLFMYTIAYTFTPLGYLRSPQSPQSRQTADLQTATYLSPVPSAISSTSTGLSLAASTSALISPVLSGPITEASLKTVSIRDSNMELARLLRNPSIGAFNESDQFQVQVVGDCHIVLKPPQPFTLRRNRPKLSVKVLRNEEIIEHELLKLFESVYAVKLKRADAYGSMNVSVWTKSKPTCNQTFVVDFGTPWLTTHGWKKVLEVMSAQVKKEYNTRLWDLRLLFGRMEVGFQRLTTPETSTGTVVPGTATRTAQTSRHRIFGTKNRVVLGIKALSRFARRQAATQTRQLVKESVRLSKKSSLLSKHFKEDFGNQARQVSALGARYLTTMCNAATGVDPAKLWAELSEMPAVRYKQSLRPVQKTALRIWKRLSGAKAKKSASAHSPPKARKSRFSRKRNR